MGVSKDAKIYIAGHRGMVGSACWRALSRKGYSNLIGEASKNLDLRDMSAVSDFFDEHKPEVVIDSAAKVGGILANNSYPYEFLMDNMLIQNNLIKTSIKANVEKFIFLGSSCIYPKLAPQPLKEEYLLTAPLEPTNEWYAIAKISGVKLCEAIRKQFNKDFVSLMPTNLYGPNDNFDLKSSHVMPALIRKFHEAKISGADEVEVWGSGTPRREFLHVDDLAQAVLLALENNLETNLLNVGYGSDLSISELADLIRNIVGFKGKLIFDSSKPDGTPRKLLDSDKIKQLGFRPEIELKEGIRDTYQWFLDNVVAS